MPAPAEEVPDNVYQLWDVCLTAIFSPFKEIYGDTWEEETYWQAVETFKAESKRMGYEDPLETLGQYGLLSLASFELIRDKLKAGPKPCFRKGWKSPYTGERVDILALAESLHHVSSSKFEGKERIVIVDFLGHMVRDPLSFLPKPPLPPSNLRQCPYQNRCNSCLEIASELSDIFEKYSGRIAVLGVINDDIHDRQKEHSVEKTRTFLETNNEGIRYSSYTDTADHLARDCKYLC